MIEQSVQTPQAARTQPSDVPEQPEAEGQRQFRRHRHRPPEGGFRRFVRKYNFEIAWLLVVTLGVILVVVDPGNLRTTLWRWANRMIDGALAAADRFLGLTARVSPADIIGVLLIVFAIGALLVRIRWQLMHEPSLATTTCPECGGEIHRMHRHEIDRMISWYVPVHRFRCSNRECEWAGLRIVTASRAKHRH